MRLGPKGALGYAIQRETPGSESIQNAVTLSSFEIKVTGSRDVNIAAVSPARVAWRYRWVKGKAPVGVPGLHFLEGAFLHGALGGHPPSFSWTMVSPHVEPVGFHRTADGAIIAEVRQSVRDLEGKPLQGQTHGLKDKTVGHVFRFRDGKVARFDIRDAA
jgi:hypothetical protein